MPLPRITHKRRESSGGVVLLGPVRHIKVAPNQHQEVTFMIHITKNSRPNEKFLLQLLSGDRPAASVTVSP